MIIVVFFVTQNVVHTTQKEDKIIFENVLRISGFYYFDICMANVVVAAGSLAHWRRFSFLRHYAVRLLHHNDDDVHDKDVEEERCRFVFVGISFPYNFSLPIPPNCSSYFGSS